MTSTPTTPPITTAPILEVVNARRMPPASWRFELSDGAVYLVSGFTGWLFDLHLQPVPHPRVDAVMQAILRWEMRGQ